MGETGTRSAEVIQWLAGNVFPFERELRARLRRSGAELQEIDDIVQDTYLQLAQLPGVGHIDDARAYLFAAARGVVLNRVRHERVVRIDQLADQDALAIVDEAPSPERRAQAKQELGRVADLMRELPARCRRVFELRRIDGMSQRAIAEQLGITEYTVAYEASRAVRLIMDALREAEVAANGDHRPRFLQGLRKRGRPRK